MPYFDNLILRRRSIIPISSSRKRGREGGAVGQGCRAKSRKAACVYKKDRADAGDDRHGRSRRRSLRRGGARLPHEKPKKAAGCALAEDVDAGDSRYWRSSGNTCGAVGDICDGRHMGFARGRIRSGTPMLLQKGGARNSNRKDGGARGMRGIHRRFIRS